MWVGHTICMWVGHMVCMWIGHTICMLVGHTHLGGAGRCVRDALEGGAASQRAGIGSSTRPAAASSQLPPPRHPTRRRPAATQLSSDSTQQRLNLRLEAEPFVVMDGVDDIELALQLGVKHV